MNAVRKTFWGSFILGVSFMLFMGSFNSILIGRNSFMDDDLGIKFAKRLDEMNGEIIRGRLTASVPKFEKEVAIAQEKTIKKVIEINKSKEKIKEEVYVEVEPKVKGEYHDLSLSGGIYGKNKIENEKGYSGSAQIIDGTLEAFSVTLPDGRSFDINTIGRMEGNLFKYEDTETRELQTGLIYSIAEDSKTGVAVILVQLTSDTNLAGTRFEFKTPAALELAEDNKKVESDNTDIAKVENTQESNDEYYSNETSEYKQEESYDQEEDKDLSQSEDGYNFNFQES